jgi:hypothetical protein
MASPYCSLVVRTDITGLKVPVGNPLLGTFQFQVGPTPPPEFFTITGIYSQRTAGCVRDTFDRLDASQSAIYGTKDPFNNNNMNIYVQQLSYAQQVYYQQLLTLFQKVYAYNSAAYLYAGVHNTTPRYYNFQTSSELSEFRQASALINKLYNQVPFYPVSSIFFLPFPPFCN